MTDTEFNPQETAEQPKPRKGKIGRRKPAADPKPAAPAHVESLGQIARECQSFRELVDILTEKGFRPAVSKAISLRPDLYRKLQDAAASKHRSFVRRKK